MDISKTVEAALPEASGLEQEAPVAQADVRQEAAPEQMALQEPAQTPPEPPAHAPASEQAGSDTAAEGSEQLGWEIEEDGAPDEEPQDVGQEAPDADKSEREQRQFQQALLREQLHSIRMLDPAVKSWEDIYAMPQYGEFARLVERGCTPVQAYQIACFEQITARRMAAAHRAATLAARGKAHLSSIPAASGDSFAVPAEVHAQYRAFFPSWSEAQIKADYRRPR